MNTTLMPFQYHNQEVRVIKIEGIPWFVAKDVCDILEHSNPSKALLMLDDDEKGITKCYTPGGEQDMAVINESGLYMLILRSNKPEAKLFRKWVTSEVLPQIRQTGRYEPTAQPRRKPTIEARLEYLEYANQKKGEVLEMILGMLDYIEKVNMHYIRSIEQPLNIWQMQPESDALESDETENLNAPR
jgi:prophage antirepressor-like protein